MSETPENIQDLVTRVAQKRDANSDSEFLDDEFDFINEESVALQQRIVALGLDGDDARQITQGLQQLDPDYVAYNR